MPRQRSEIYDNVRLGKQNLPSGSRRRCEGERAGESVAMASTFEEMTDGSVPQGAQQCMQPQLIANSVPSKAVDMIIRSLDQFRVNIVCKYQHRLRRASIDSMWPP